MGMETLENGNLSVKAASVPLTTLLKEFQEMFENNPGSHKMSTRTNVITLLTTF